MKRHLSFWAVLLCLLAGCSQDTPAAGNTLVVTDGDSQQSYKVNDLKALGAEQASFREVSYTGVPLYILLEDAGFDLTSIRAVKATAADGFSANYDSELVNRPDTLVAYARVGRPMADDEGAFRMVLPGQEGKLNPRDLIELRVYP